MIIKLTTDGGDIRYVNSDIIAYFYKMSDLTLVQYKPIIIRASHEETDNYLLVKETPEEICEMLGAVVLTNKIKNPSHTLLQL